jgi:uncharacterized protein (TIGR02145 family)
MGLFLIFVSSCEKDDNNPLSGNSTNGKTTAVFNPSVTYGTIIDQDGNTYKTVTIGTQIWMAENLRTTKYNDSTIIPNVISNNEWDTLTRGAYCNYNNTSSIDSIATFGRLYNWHAVNTGKLAPKGWHVPTNADWTTLTDFLGAEIVAGGKLKENGPKLWVWPNSAATNKTGFTALPGGSRGQNGKFYDVGYYGTWWCADETGTNLAWGRDVGYATGYIAIDYVNKTLGFSVRCVRD